MCIITSCISAETCYNNNCQGDTENLKRKEPQKKLKRFSKNPLTKETKSAILKSSKRWSKAPNKRKVVDTMKKMTYAEAINSALNANLSDEVKDRLNDLLVSLANRNKKGGERKPTKVQKENEVLKASIMESFGEPQTASAVAEQFGISNQKASALLNQLVADNLLKKFVGEKRRTFFEVA